ncbi:class II fumarate hydratase [Periweissella beninensis]|uniref:Fumarate hydratase class II n=1 Tax=Periweissella beninensis TaxID=504936 RepID=A0ABT0VHG7_9LACO|nr:class II fumarate hydratase [Periweissella beninensis]MBM7543423.1 fumarate hydratase class II [Periweissella beninensis]MCM2437283.1 class II fumarate hydratase [Periweissella beninensis]MCT4396090.1 class II fumarate hydratase [Periweissella beninensis]
MVEYRIEEDTLGAVKIPSTALWGAQTERSRNNFPTGDPMPLEIVKALLQIKKAAAIANKEAQAIEADKADLIVKAIDSLLALEDAELRKDFPLVIYQTGSGTQSNMNANEVVAHMAAKIDDKIEILPNDHVNHGQSSNDIFPTAMNITAAVAVDKLITAAQHLIDELKVKQEKYWRTVKVGRTHLQDATPLTFGQEVSGWVSMLEHDVDYLQKLNPTLSELAMGGTAVGTGLNAAPHFADKIASLMTDTYQHAFTADSNKFYGLAAHSGLNVVHGAIKTLASDLMKIANDVRFLASGPRSGYGELNIPANEPGSSIMPGKVNPTQAEAITMAAVRVMGNDVVVNVASSQGNFEMNVYKPVLISAFLESAELMAGTIMGFADKMIAGLTVNAERMQELVDQSLMTVTALSPHIGYHDSAVIAQQAEKEGLTLREAAVKSGFVSGEDFDKWVVPLAMTNIDKA